jgi:hypothetical protein
MLFSKSEIYKPCFLILDIAKNVLWLDITVGDIFTMQASHCEKKLIKEPKYYLFKKSV